MRCDMLSSQYNLIEKVPRAGLLSINLPGHFSFYGVAACEKGSLQTQGGVRSRRKTVSGFSDRVGLNPALPIHFSFLRSLR